MVSWIDNFSPQDQFLIIWNYITSFMVDLKEHLSPKLFMIWNYLTSFMVILKNNISLQLLIVLNYLKQVMVSKSDNKYKFIITNIFLIIYYMSPNFITFLLITISILILDPFKQKLLKQIQNNSRGMVFIQSINNFFFIFKRLPLNQQLITLVIFQVSFGCLWYIPSWLVIFFVTEIFALWNLLQQQNTVYYISKYINNLQNYIQVGITKIPKYNKNKQ